MQILHSSDFHSNDQWYRWLINESEKYDLVCLAGDQIDLNPHRLPGAQADRVLAHLRQLQCPLAVCSGNHDGMEGPESRLVDAAWLRELRAPNVWVDGDTFTLGGHRFRVLGWQSPLQVAAPGELWISHCPPDLCPTGIVRGGVDFGDFELGELARSGLGPRVPMSGHCHDRQRWCAKVGRTLSLNPGRFHGPWPAHIVIDLDRNIASYFGPEAAAGGSRISLGPV